MTQFSKQSGRSIFEQPSKNFSLQQKPSLRFWLLLVGGSALLHLLLIRWVGAIIVTNSQPAAVPIDLIHLSSPDNSAHQLAASSSPDASRSTAHVEPIAAVKQTSSPTTAALPSLTPEVTQPDLALVLPQTQAQTQAQTQLQTQPSRIQTAAPQIASPASRQFAAILPATAPRSPRSATTQLYPVQPQPPQPLEQSLEPQISQIAQPQIAQPQVAQPQISPAPTPTASIAPQTAPTPMVAATAAQPVQSMIVSQPITLPVPDLSQPHEQEITSSTPVPSYLTANLTASVLPAADPLEQPAQPQVEVQHFLTNSQLPPCAVTPEAVFFLGETVAIQVSTNAAGQVVETVTHESSRSLAYDELATCLVRNWSFKPAIAQGQPVANSGLMVRITIDRS